MYYKCLPKANPMFALLLSPSESLTDEERVQLLEALKADHKELFLELVGEKRKY